MGTGALYIRPSSFSLTLTLPFSSNLLNIVLRLFDLHMGSCA